MDKYIEPIIVYGFMLVGDYEKYKTFIDQKNCPDRFEYFYPDSKRDNLIFGVTAMIRSDGRTRVLRSDRDIVERMYKECPHDILINPKIMLALK